MDDSLALDHDLWLLLDRYLAGGASAQEAEAVRDWLAADTNRGAILEDLKHIREIAGRRPPVRSVDGAWENAARSLNLMAGAGHASLLEKRDAAIVRPAARRHTAFWRNVAAAAVVLAVCGALGTVWLRHGTLAWPFGAQQLAGRAAQASPRVFTTQRGQRAEIRLGDGTRVVLAAESRLIVPADFDSLSRDVTLEGEANFEAVHNLDRPFTVHASNAVVQDIGTRFDVRAFAADRGVRVIVTEGKVRLRARTASPHESALLERGALGRVDINGSLSVLRDVDTSRYVAWTHGTLMFEKTPVAEAIAELARWYDVDIRLADSSFAQRRVTATLRDQPLSAMLSLFALSLDARVEQRGRVVTLHPHPTVRGAP